MDETKNDTPVQEVVDESTTKKEQTVGEMMGEEPKSEKKEESVPLSEFLEIKKANKLLTKELKDFKKSVEDGASDKEIASDIDTLADENNVDKNFLRKFAKAIKAETEKDLEEKISSKLKPIEDKERAENVSKVFNSHFDKVLDEMPEYKEIVNRDVIKSLSLQRENQSKTFAQILEETYGNAIRGKRTIETATPRGGKEPESIDYDRMRTDDKYYDEVMKNPSLKKEWNDNLIKNIRL